MCIRDRENLDAKRIEINRLIVEVEKLLDRERTPFFAQAPDEELLTIARELKTELLSAGHSLIHSQQDIIDYLNQIRTQVGFTRKLRRIKYLREQFELQENTNVREVVDVYKRQSIYSLSSEKLVLKANTLSSEKLPV